MVSCTGFGVRAVNLGLGFPLRLERWLLPVREQSLYNERDVTKQEFLDMVQALPDDAAFDQLAAEVEKVRFRAKVQKGLDQLTRGEGIPHEEVEAMMDGWLQE